MDYYAAWPVWKMPKWLGAALGGIFTMIVVGCAWLIVDLTRPPKAHPVAAAAAATLAAAAPKVPAAARPETVAVVQAATPDATPAAVPARVEQKPTKKTHDVSRSRQHAILAKRDSKSTRMTKGDIDRLLGL